jgi:dolichyl-diphosphooligosaccharide--protein glycosyltransferase
VIKIVILALIALLAFAVRIFSVIRFESVIHEFDPWFNFRTTKYLAQEGLYQFWNWFDSESWYPLGRVIGGTIFPGIMVTSASIKWIADWLSFPIDVRNVCVFLAPVFAGLTSISTYFFTKECTNRSEAGLFAALFISIVPSYISRSVAGSYDNEGVAIWALITTFWLWVKAVNTGSIFWSVACTLSYFYMVAAWGGYNFIINIIPIFVLGTIFINRFSMKIYVAYSVFYVIGTVMAMLIPFVGFNAIRSSEHLASHCVFAIMNVYVVIEYVRRNLPEEQFVVLTRLAFGLATAAFGFLFVFITVTGATRWSGRSLTLLDPTYAKKYIPIIASVSEHQPTSWSSYFFDLQYLMIFIPVGFYFSLKHKVTYGKLFLGLYGVLSTYFSCVMIRLMLVVAPAACVLAAIGLSEILRKMSKVIRANIADRQNAPAAVAADDASGAAAPEQKAGKKKAAAGGQDKQVKKRRIPMDGAIGVMLFFIWFLSSYIYHSTYMAAEAYSSPSIILASRRNDGSRVIIDDFREAYYWLKMNTAKDAKILSWWDYGYQITGMGNRTVLVDNNTWNNTHIATVGRVNLIALTI